jgi:hypothetical protein
MNNYYLFPKMSTQNEPRYYRNVKVHQNGRPTSLEISSLFGKHHRLTILKTHFVNQHNFPHIYASFRKYGDSAGQYVTSYRFTDSVYYSDDGEVFDVEENEVVYSSRHDDCPNCKEFKRKEKENALLGFVIHPKGRYEHRRPT